MSKIQNIVHRIPKSFRDDAVKLVKSGWSVKNETKGIVFYSPNGIDIIRVHQTPSDYRVFTKFRQSIRRYSKNITL